MKFTIITTFKLIFLMLIFTSCDSMISDVDVPESEPKLSIHSYISPDDDTIKVSLQLTKPLYTPSEAYTQGFETVKDAGVKISDGTNSIQLTFLYNQQIYYTKTTDFPIVAGRTYQLEVSSPDGKLATAQCTVPSGNPPDIESITIDTINMNGYIEKTVSFKFRDLEGQGNFYRVQAGIMYQYEMQQTYFYTIYLENGLELVSDSNKEGDLFFYKTDRIGSGPGESNKIYINLCNTDINYFNYHRSIFNFEEGNPFTEPTPVYSNISGGVGVFAAYLSHITVVDLN